jgi:hypothetical protein
MTSQLAIDFAEQRRKTIQERFEDFHATNPWVYDELCRLARRVKARGHQRIAIDYLFGYIRWTQLMRPVDPTSPFKLNDHYRSRYARLIMAREPDLVDLFETRELKAS